jgi:leucyl aminopeptidase
MKKTGIVLFADTKEFNKYDKKCNKYLSQLSDFNSKNDDELKPNDSIDINHNRYLKDDYVSVHKKEINTAEDARQIGGMLYNKFKFTVDKLKIEIDTPFCEDLLEGVELASYEFNHYKSKTNEPRLKKVKVKGAKGKNIGKSINFARDLVNEPGNILVPKEYAYRIKNELEPLGVKVKTFSEKKLKKMGFDLLLSVGQGSKEESYVVVMEYENDSYKRQPIAYVGKGVTFDTGGISLKPSSGMGDMKMDMSGSASVVGAMHAIASHKLKTNVVGVVGLVENMPDGNAIKPGDVVTSLSGLTVENLNTDAEGRLVLADLLTYVQDEYEPSSIIDLATLTGAILVSLGNEMAGVFTNSSEMNNVINDIGNEAGEFYWRMPMGQNWNKMLDSGIADMKNIGSGRYGGSTTAAEFLYRFIDEETPWVHLDIAGVAWTDKDTNLGRRGATGFGVRTLYEYAKLNKEKFDIDEHMKY